jgi:lipopolysaccharide/colanic/teichoic acid biosynthesis glycosyltransferase
MLNVANFPAVADFAPRLATPAPAFRWGDMVKRVFDLALATALFIALLPLLVVLVAAVCVESPGNPIFVQRRLGRNGKVFPMLKLRTMVPHAEHRRAEVEHLNEAKAPLFKCKNDPRVLRIGKILRATSLDELPQLLNVIRGQMSIVGPRPRLPQEFATVDAAITRRMSVKPGLAGLWQVSGRATLDFDEALALDLQYIDNRSFWYDLKLIARTLWVVITLQGAY